MRAKIWSSPVVTRRGFSFAARPAARMRPSGIEATASSGARPSRGAASAAPGSGEPSYSDTSAGPASADRRAAGQVDADLAALLLAARREKILRRRPSRRLLRCEWKKRRLETEQGLETRKIRRATRRRHDPHRVPPRAQPRGEIDLPKPHGGGVDQEVKTRRIVAHGGGGRLKEEAFKGALRGMGQPSLRVFA